MSDNDEQLEEEAAAAAVPPNSVELHPKRTDSFRVRGKKKKKKPAVRDEHTNCPPSSGWVEVCDMALLKMASVRERTKYWARIVLLFPLVPVCLALTTIVFGGVIINVATNDCNSDLMRAFV
ncbi:hypothetical protein BBJ28_00012751 [Nothophytophthora sp. Chile5]|nr:hypothetical protein BBJ28_00012751 [Nothophytophthora sp. Chile5]